MIDIKFTKKQASLFERLACILDDIDPSDFDMNSDTMCVLSVQSENFNEGECDLMYKVDHSDFIDTWLYCSEWSEIDNTPTGAAERIRTMLSGEIPLDTDLMQRAYAYETGNDPKDRI